MLTQSIVPSRKTGPYRVSFPVTVTATLALILGAVVLAVAGDQANRAEAHAEQERVAITIVQQQLRASEALDWLAQNREQMLAAITAGSSLPQMIQAQTFDRLMIVDVAQNIGPGRSAAGINLGPVLAKLQGRDSPEQDSDVTGAISADPVEPGQFVTMGDNIYSVAAAPVTKAVQPSALVGMQLLDEAYLSSLARIAGTAPLQITTGNAGSDGQLMYALGGAGNGEQVQALAWQPERPGDSLMLRWGVILAGGAICLALVLIWQANRAIRQLRESEERARKLAGLDLLSGLPNRFLFTQLLDQEFARASRGGGPFALMYLDMDRFREINDLLGHDAGDAVIVGVTARISAILRAGDRLARFGGDEFAILQTEISGPADAEELASRLFEALQQPIDIGTERVAVRLSGGIALYPQDATTRQDLMRNADEALNRAKGEGRDRYTFFQKRLGEDMRSRKATEDELRQAIASSGLAVYYQPIMTVDGERIACVEALVRWPHPVRGLVSPDHFISLAEDRGLILPLGEYVLRQACRDGKRWPGVRVAVNVSPIQFRQEDFAKMVERVLEEEQFEPTMLELELTEGVVIADADQAENVIMDLRALGVRLALDDFGTGYSSLVYLRRFAFDKIKIDRSFLEAMEGTGESAIIVHSIIHLGRALGLTVTAEGIETAEQHRFLQAAGAHELQGFLFSKPVPAPEIDRMLENQANRLAGQPIAQLRSVA